MSSLASFSINPTRVHRHTPHIVCTPGLRHRLFQARDRPIFQGDWWCSRECLQQRIRTMRLREAAARVEGSSHQHRIPLGLLLHAQGFLSHQQLQHAMQVQREAGVGRIGDWITRIYGLDERLITRMLARQWGCTVLSTAGFQPERMALAAPRQLLESAGALPIRLVNNTLYLAFEEEADASLAFAIESILQLPVEKVFSPARRLREARATIAASHAVHVTEHAVADEAAFDTLAADLIFRTGASEARLARVHRRLWLRIWTTDDTTGLPSFPGNIEDHLFSLINL